MREHAITAIPADGIGPEVIAAGITVLQALAQRLGGVRFTVTTFDITGKGIASPVASFWTAAQMLEHLGEDAAAERLMHAVERVCATGIRTPDVGGTARGRSRIG